MRLADATLHRPLFQALLELLHAALAAGTWPPAAGDAAVADPAAALPALPPAVRRAAEANAAAFAAAGGCELAVDLAAGAHGAPPRPPRVPAARGALPAGLLLTGGAEAAAAAPAPATGEWYIVPRGSDGSEREGPLTRDALRARAAAGALGPASLVWATGMAHPQPLQRVRELRWLIAAGGAPGGGLSAVQAAEAGLQMLLRLTLLHPATDEDGRVLCPLPRVHRLLAGPACLPHIAQARWLPLPSLLLLLLALPPPSLLSPSHSIS